MTDRDHEIDQMLDERSILRVMNRYCQALDYAHEDEWVSLFLPDGTFGVYRGDQVTAFHSAERDLRAWFSNYHATQPSPMKHLMLQPVIHVKGDGAEATSYLFSLRQTDGIPDLYVFGRYRDKFQKVSGEWFIQERRAEVETG